MANEAMEAAWNGDEGEHWAAYADTYDAVSLTAQAKFFASLPLTGASRVLDVGCGSGALALRIAEQCPEGRVLGIDLSAAMLEVAGKRAAARGVTNATFTRADAQTFAFESEAFDLTVSSFGAMFFDDPVTAFGNIGTALRPGGELRLFAWRALPENEWLMNVRAAVAVGRDLPLPPPDAPTPFSLADRDRTTAKLTAAGFGEVGFEPVDEQMNFGANAEKAYDFMSTQGAVKGMTETLDADKQAEAFANLRQTLEANATPAGVVFNSAAWIISARKPG